MMSWTYSPARIETPRVTTSESSPPTGLSQPSRVRVFLVIWAAAFIVVTTFQVLAGPLIERWPLLLRTLLLSGVMVAIIMGVIQPSLSRLPRLLGARRGG